jgi:Flp pilus assembly secretin CpaC
MRSACFILLTLLGASPLVLGEEPNARPAPKTTATTTLPPTKAQIAISVQVFELSANRLKQRGSQLQEAQKQLDALLPEKTADGKATETFDIKLRNTTDTAELFHRLHQDGVARLLAEPTVVTVAGQPASYFSGGEVRAPGNPNDTNQKIKVRRYGTELNYLPLLLDNGRLRLELRARVSQLDPSLDLVVRGDRFPGVRVVEVDTGVEMEFGQTAVIGGLRQLRAARNTEKEKLAAANHDEITTVFLITPKLIPAVARFTAPVPSAPRKSPGKAGG